MKKIWKKLRKKSVEAFTLVEMLIVLLNTGQFLCVTIKIFKGKKEQSFIDRLKNMIDRT